MDEAFCAAAKEEGKGEKNELRVIIPADHAILSYWQKGRHLAN